MSARFSTFVPLLTLLAVGAASAGELAAQKPLPEPRVGVAFKPPKGWVELPGGGDRGATLRLFAAPRAVADKKTGFTHTPLLRVMSFSKDGDPALDTVDGLPRRTPFRSFDDFAQRGLGSQQVGVRHESAQVGALNGQRATATLGFEAGDRQLTGFLLPLEGGECAVCFEVLADHQDKLKKDIEATLATLSACDLVPDTYLAPPWIVDPAAWATMDAASRTTSRSKWAEDLVTATARNPEAGYKVKKSKYWTVVSAADASFTKKATAAAEAARAFLQQVMPEAADNPLAAVLRIFDSPDHLYAYLATRTDLREYVPERRELLFVDDPDLGGSNGYGMLFRAVLWHYLDDLDPGILPALPRWLENGCWEFMRSTRFDGRKIEFSPSDVEKGRVDYQLRGAGMPPLWDLIQESMQPSPEGGADEDPWGYTPECARLLRWWWMHDGQKAFDNPHLLHDYVRGLAAAFAERGPDPTAMVEWRGLSDSQRKAGNAAHYAWRDGLSKAVSFAVLPKEEVWRAANERWLKFNKDYD